MRYELVPRRVTLLMYSDDDVSNINYSSSCQININGTKGTIDTVNGKDFFKFMNIHAKEVLVDKLGLTEVGAAVGEPMLRKIQKIPGITVTVSPEMTNVNGIELYWINITFVQ